MVLLLYKRSENNLIAQEIKKRKAGRPKFENDK